MKLEDDKLVFFTQVIDPAENKIPLVSAKVSAGFPSPAENYIEETLDLNKHLIKNPPATFLVRVDGDSMINAGIHPGDIIVVDRSVEAKNNDVIIAIVDGQFTVKRLSVKNDKVALIPENPNYQAIYILDEMEFEVWGKVISVIHKF